MSVVIFHLLCLCKDLTYSSIYPFFAHRILGRRGREKSGGSGKSAATGHVAAGEMVAEAVATEDIVIVFGGRGVGGVKGGDKAATS